MIVEEEKTKYENEPYTVLQERLIACTRALAQAKREVLNFETRASVLRQIIGQNADQGSKIAFLICPVCETIFTPEVTKCSRCGFTEDE